MCLFTYSEAQRANNWYFGANAGLSFSTSPPTPLAGGQSNVPDNSSSISDQNGNLLFYTTGTTVWNKNHGVMPNGTGLIGSYTGGQCALIVPIPCSNTKYAIFQVTDFANPGYLHYTIVDMSLNMGLGDVVVTQKNVSLGTGWTEKLCAYYNSSGNYYWLLAHKWNSNQFVAFNVSAGGVATQSVVSAIGSVHNCGFVSGAHDSMGQLTISPDGTKVINALTCQDLYELFDFNVNTGTLSNFITLSGNGGNAWGTAFSPDSKKIFTDAIFGQTVYQYDINVYNQSAIQASKVAIGAVTTGGYNFGYMELGPDNKLYIARPGTGFLSVVNTPNGTGFGSGFVVNGQGLGSASSTHGTSRIAYNIPATTFTVPLVVNASTQSITCHGLSNGSATINTLPGNITYQWSPGNYTTASVQGLAAGVYSVSVSDGGCGYGSTVVTITQPQPILMALNTPTICRNQQSQLTPTISGGVSPFGYSWSPGNITTSTLAISGLTATATFTLHILDGNGCPSATSTTVFVSPSIGVTISGTTLVCIGVPVNLTASGAPTYTWSNNATSAAINVTPFVTTTYSVIGYDPQTKCTGQTSITVNVSECIGIQEKSQNGLLRIFPNPVRDILTLESAVPESEIKELIVFNSAGQILYSALPQNGSIILSHLPPGMYYLKLSTGNGNYVEKLIKE